MTKLNEVTGNIHVYNNGVKFVQFDLLKAIEGDFVISSSTLTTLQIPELINVGGALNIFGMGKGAISTLVFPKVQTVKNSLSINEISTLKSISFPELIETGSINFHLCLSSLKNYQCPNFLLLMEIVLLFRTIFKEICFPLQEMFLLLILMKCRIWQP